MNEIIELKIIFFGSVQGVCFRATVKKYADFLKIKGFVKNLRDSSVLLIAQSSKEELEKLIDMILKNPKNAKIEKIEKSFSDAVNIYSDFEIIY